MRISSMTVVFMFCESKVLCAALDVCYTDSCSEFFLTMYILVLCVDFLTDP
jgi:hypothetical protein